MERLPVSMLCATKPDAAAKHHGGIAQARFDRSSIALQHALVASKPESPLVFHYTLSLFCCRYGTVLRTATEPLIPTSRFEIRVNRQKCELHCTFGGGKLRFGPGEREIGYDRAEFGALRRAGASRMGSAVRSCSGFRGIHRFGTAGAERRRQQRAGGIADRVPDDH